VKVFTPIKKVGKSEKLLLRYFGPYEIIEKKGEVDYLVRMGRGNNARNDVVHVGRILPYYDPWVSSDPMYADNNDKLHPDHAINDTG
jgi:hypothetical protein